MPVKKSKCPQAYNEKLADRKHARQNQDAEREKQRRQAVNEIKAEITELLKTSDEAGTGWLVAQRDALMERMSSINLAKQKSKTLTHLKTFTRYHFWEERKFSAILSDVIVNLCSKFRRGVRQKKERAKKLKPIDTFRKSRGSSGLRFEKQWISTQDGRRKERLEKINAGIKEIEDEIPSSKAGKSYLFMRKGITAFDLDKTFMIIAAFASGISLPPKISALKRASLYSLMQYPP